MKKVYLFFLFSTFLFSDIPNIFVIKKVDFRDNLFIYLKNESGKKLGIGKVFINDKDIEKLAKKGQVDEEGKLFKKTNIDQFKTSSKGWLRIGDGECGRYYPDGYFKGIIDEFKVYKRALGEEEIKKEYESLKK